MNFLKEIANAFHRMVTLPKGANSAADILPKIEAAIGPDLAATWIATLRDKLASTVTDGLTHLAGVAAGDLAHAQDFVATAIIHSFSHVPEPIHAEITAAVGVGLAALKADEKVLLSKVPSLASAVLAEVGKVLKL